MKTRNILYMESWVNNKELSIGTQELSNTFASIKASNDYFKGVVDNTHPKHSKESYAYMKKYNELREKYGH